MMTSRQQYAITCIISLLLLAWCYYPTAATFDARWSQPHQAYSHGYAVLAVCIALAIRQWPNLAAAHKSPYWPAFIPLLGLSLLWLAARVANVLVVQQLALPAIVFMTLLGLLGKSVARHLRFPFALFYAVVPVWDALNPLLQTLTVKVCTIGLKLLGIPAYIEATQISIPSGTLQVAGGCSGLNYLLMISIISAVYAHLYYHSKLHKITLMLVAVAFGLVCNWIRVFSLVVIGYVTKMQSPLMAEHEVMGWIIFAICLVPFLYIALHIETTRVASDRAKLTDAAPAVQGLPNASWRRAIAVGLAAVIGPLWYLAVSGPSDSGGFALALSESQPALTSPITEPQWRPAFVNADEYAVFNDVRTAPPTELHVVTYLTQEQGKELVQWDNRIADEQSWRLISEETITDERGAQFRKAAIQGTGRRAEVLYWYAIGDRFTASDSRAKILQVVSFLKGREEASLLAIFYLCPAGSCEYARTESTKAAVAIKKDYLAAFDSRQE